MSGRLPDVEADGAAKPAAIGEHLDGALPPGGCIDDNEAVLKRWMVPIPRGQVLLTQRPAQRSGDPST